MGKFSKIILGLGMIAFVSCSPSSLTPEAYMSWVKDPGNGLHLSKALKDYRYELQYRPSEMIVLQEQKETIADKASFDERISEMNDLQYYNLQLFGPNGKAVISQNNPEAYFGNLEYYSSYAQADISMVQQGDTLPCALFHLERYYDLSPYNTLVLGFPKTENEHAERTLVFNDRALNMGPVKFNISSSELENIPNLQIPQ